MVTRLATLENLRVRWPACDAGRLRFRFPVAIPEGPHPFPSRTRKLSPPGPMVLRWQRRGRVGRRRGLTASGGTSRSPRYPPDQRPGSRLGRSCVRALRRSAEEGGVQGEGEGEDRHEDAGAGEQVVDGRLRTALGERDDEAGAEAADEAAKVGETVNAGHEEAEDEEQQRPLAVLTQDHRSEHAAPPPSDRHRGTQQTEDR